ncbi:MAG TPA: transcription termination factor Rho [Candidatus Egerieimonas intestinavium]|uniref:Transcription termination factor Rho n=1 Tax=Candidatus Egerieimonas intestinavium TaxID=2840777 RepID=A0A9D1EJN3_9FIRM|nr:transcription termination factor Rho [Candidatus Egerieimonas intestinavium]
MREKYESLSASVLHELAKARGLKGTSSMKKSELITRMLEEDERESAMKEMREKAEARAEERSHDRERGQDKERSHDRERGQDKERSHDREKAHDKERSHDKAEERQENEEKKLDYTQLDSGQSAQGILEVLQDGYGFIRSNGYLPGENDVYVSPSQIRRFNLKTGDILKGNTRVKSQNEKFGALLYVTSINGMTPGESARRMNFEDMTPIFPNERLRLERQNSSLAMRIVDLVSPIGKGQRGMIASPPKAGKTTLLKDVAKSILQNNPETYLIILLIDERPEEVTDIREAIQGNNVEIVASTFDELPDRHKRVSEMVVERAKRLVEHKKDVVILLDSITRLARAYNLVIPPSGRTLSGGLDPAALHMPKRFFGAARNMREGGSLTILATALVETGSKMDDVVYEEFKGTGNMELILDRKLQEKRVFPAIDIQRSSTRREDLLLDQEEQEGVEIMRRALNGMKADEAVENILNMFSRTRNNREFIGMIKKQKIF